MAISNRDFITFLFVLLWNIFHVECKGTLAIQLVDFHNPQGLDIHGQCCDGVKDLRHCPLEKCDHHFSICVGDRLSINLTENICAFGKEEVNGNDDVNDNHFPDGSEKLFRFDIWKEWAYISVAVTDSDSEQLEPVDNLVLNYTTPAAGYNSSTNFIATYTLHGNRSTSPTSLSLKVKVYCDSHYYGDDCSINCVADNACSGHYTCDYKGQKMCNDAWKGDNCDIQIPGGVADCSVYQNRTEFVPSLWRGQYQCNGEQAQTFTLNATHSSGNIQVQADMTVQSVVIPLSGSYASHLQVLTLQAQTLVSHEIRERNFTRLKLELQEKKDQATEMIGFVEIDDESCDVPHLSRIVAYFEDCNFHETCVRFGSHKDEVYCCKTTIHPTTTPTKVSTPAQQSTSTSSTTTPKQSTETPELSTTTPEQSTTMSGQSTTTPEQSTTMSGQSTTTPEQSTTTPEQSTTMSGQSTTTPEQSTTTPEQSTTTSEQSTTTSEQSTTTPEQSTTTPEQSTTTPEQSTTTSEQSTTTPEQSTTTPEQSTTTPEQSTTTPEQSTTTPEQSTTTSEQLTTTAEQSTTTPEQSTTTPEQSTTTPEQSTTTPEQSTTTSEQSTTTAEQSTTTPEQSTTTSDQSTTTPEQSTTTPQQSTTTAERLTTTAEWSTTTPEQSTTTSKQSTTTAEQSTTTPEWSTTTPEQSTTTPEQSTTTPEQSTTTSERSTTTSKQSTTTPVQTTTPTKSTTTSPTPTSSTTKRPTTSVSTTKRPTTSVSTTKRPTTSVSTSKRPTASVSTTKRPTTSVSTTKLPTTSVSTTKRPTTSVSTTKRPTASVSTTKRPTTSVSTTKRPTTSVSTTKRPTTSVSTTKRPTTSVSTTKRPTTSVSTTKRPTTSVSTTVSTAPTGSTAAHPDTRNVTQHVFLELVQEEVNYDFITNGTIMAWVEANTGKAMTGDMFQFVAVTKYQAIGDSGVDVCAVSLTLTVPYAAKQPSAAMILLQIQLVVNSSAVRLYTGSTNHLQWYRVDHALAFLVEGAGPRQDHRGQWQMAIWNALNETCGDQSCVSPHDTINIKKTEEYVGPDGLVLTKNYYFVERGGRPSYMSSLMVHYHWGFTSVGLTDVSVYTGGTVVRYRFHYALFVEREVFTDDIPKFQSLLKHAWTTQHPDLFKDCHLCNFTIRRQERYFGYNGALITALVYFISLPSHIQSPILVPPPSVAMFNSSLTFTDPNNSSYTLYMGTAMYRYIYHYSLLISGQVDLPGVTKLLQSVVSAAWSNWTLTNKALIPNDLNWKLTIMTHELYVSQEGEFVTNLICYFTDDNGVVQDARVTMAPTLSWLSNWTRNRTDFRHGNGEPYEVFTVYKRREMYRFQETFVVYVDGYVYYRDISTIQRDIEKSWNSTFNMGCSANVVKTLIYMRNVNGTDEISTALHYTLLNSVTKKMMLSTRCSVTRRTMVYQDIKARLTGWSVGRKYSVLSISPSSWFVYEWHFELYFTTRIGQLDLDKVKHALQAALKVKWKDYSLYQNLVVYIAFQEKVYMETKSVWRLVYFLKSSDKGVVSPQWVTPITGNMLNGSLAVVSLQGHTYDLYLGQRSTSLYLYRSHFSLTFTQEVSVYDYSRIIQDLQTKWCQKISGCKDNSSVTIIIKEQEHLLDVHGVSYWRLIYFVQKGKTFFDSKFYQGIDWSGYKFTWSNQYGVVYTLVTARHTSLWPFSYAFNLYYHIPFYSTQAQKDRLNNEILAAWSKMAIPKKDCGCLSVFIARQHQLASTSGTLWQLTYFLQYKNEYGHSWSVDSRWWPHLNSTTPQHLQAGIDLAWYQTLASFYSSAKVSITDFSSLETDMTATFLVQHPEFKACGCYKVKIEFQEEVVDSDGHTAWQLHYHIYNDHKLVPQSLFRPLNWTYFGHHYTVIGRYGHHYDFSWMWSWQHRYTRYSSLGGVYMSHWVSHSDYHHLVTALREYYTHYYGGSKNVSLSINVPVREYFSIDGSSVWHVPFLLTVDGVQTYPPPINTSALQASLNMTTPQGARYTLIPGSKVTSTEKFTSITVDHKVSSTAYDKIKMAIIKTLVQQYPEWKAAWLKISFGPQREMVDQKGHSWWKLYYSLSLNGTSVDTKGMLHINSTGLTTNMASVTGPNSVHYHLVNPTGQRSTATLMSVYLSSYMSVTDLDKMESAMKQVWKEHYRSSAGISVDFVRQKKFVKTNGESLWKWDYVLKVNGSVIRPDAVQTIDTGRLTELTNTSLKIQLKTWTAFYINHEKHFSLYVANKIADIDLSIVKDKIHKAWLNMGETVTVDIVSQEELVDLKGRSSWRLVYFVKKGSMVLDGRVTETTDSSALGIVSGPRGPYHFLQGTAVTSGLRYSLGASVDLNHQLDKVGIQLLTDSIRNRIENNTALKNEVNVTIVRQEEYMTSNGMRGWKVVYFVTVDGEYVPASSLHYAVSDRPLGSYKGPHGVEYKVTPLLYNFRDRFTVTLTTKVTPNSFASLKTSLSSAWKLTRKEYQTCNCIQIDDIKSGYIEEVVDHNGKSYWQLSYFLKKNSSVIESLTHIPLNLTHLRNKLAGVTNAKGVTYGLVDTALVSVGRLSLAFHIFLDKETVLKSNSSLQNFTKQKWQKQLGIASVEVEWIRMRRYVDAFWTPLWRVDYFIRSEGNMLDPATLPDLTFGHTSFPGLHGVSISVISSKFMTTNIDYRWRFQLVVHREVEKSHLQLFQLAVTKYWNSSVNGSVAVTVSIPEQVKMVNRKGTFYWSLSVFVYDQSLYRYIDSQLHADLNVTAIESRIQSLINVTDAGQMYTLVSQSSLSGSSQGLRRYEAGFAIYLSSFVKRTFLVTLSSHLAQLWQTKDFDTTSMVTVDIVKQEQLITSTGNLVSKMTYFLQVNDTDLQSGQISELDHQHIQDVVTKVTGHESAVLTGVRESVDGTSQSTVTMETVYSYGSLFSLALTRPMVDKDTSAMELQLAKAWVAQMGAANRLALIITTTQTDEIRIDLNTLSPAVMESVNLDVIRVGFSTKFKDGVLLKVIFDGDSSLCLAVTRLGGVRLTFNMTSNEEEIKSSQGIDYTDGEYHVIEIRTQTVSPGQGIVYMKIDNSMAAGDFTVPLGVIGSPNAVLIGANGTKQGLDGQIFLVQVGGFYPLKYIFQNTTKYGMINAEKYSVGHQQTATLMADIEDILHLSTEILHQEEIITQERKNVWNVKYAVTINKRTQLRSAQETPLSYDHLQSYMNLTISGSNHSYIQYIVNDNRVDSDSMSYGDLYHMYVSQRVAVHDYHSIQANLSALWKSVENLTKSVTLMTQEKVINTKGQAYWQLSYHVSSTDATSPVIPRFVGGVTTPSLTHGVITVSPLGVPYHVVEVGHAYRLTQAYQFTVTRRVRRRDEVMVRQGVLDLVNSTHKGLLAPVLVKVSMTERVVNEASGLVSWQYSYIIVANGTTLDAARQTALNVDTLSKTVSTVTSIAYRVKQGVFLAYSDMFGLTVAGQVSSTVTSHVQTQLTEAWRQHVNDRKIAIVNLRRQEFIGENGTTITKYLYFVKRNRSILYPSLVSMANTAGLVRNLSITLYTGEVETDYQDCYKLQLQGQRGSLDKSAISHTLQTTWTGQVTGAAVSNYSIQFVKTEEELGTFGLKLLSLVYTVTKDSVALTPDYQASPNDSVLATAVSASGQLGVVYTGQQETFRMSGLYNFGIQHLNTTTMTSKDRTNLEQMVYGVWNTSVSGNGEVTIDILVSQEFRTKDDSAKMSKVFYTVKIDDKVNENWEISVPSIESKLSTALTQTVGLQNKYLVTNSFGGSVRSLYLKGKVKVSADVLKQVLTLAWQENRNGESLKLDIISKEKFVTQTWDYVTKVRFVVSVNQSDPQDQGVQPPSYKAIEDKLTTAQLRQSGHLSLKYNRVHVRGSSASLNYTHISLVMQSAWNSKNSEVGSMLTVTVKQASQRHRRAASDSYILVDDKSHEISPLEYTVSLNEEEPSAMFVDTPSKEDISAGLAGADTGLCMCQPRLAAQLKVKGQVSGADQDKVTDAVKDAFVKENPELTKDDLDVELSITNITDSSGQRSSDVDYIVGRKDNGDVEDLARPDEAQLTSHIQAMYSRAVKVPDSEQEDWVIPVAVASGIVGFILIVIIVCYVIYIRRHRKKGDFIRQGEEVRNNNAFDREHFSDPAMYDDEGPLKYDNPAYSNKLYTSL